ncbi:hypothetical protein [Nonomuraea dietziae]|uniref:hypothetical protein n=1 Tax=Nonomuraea dietziae TaxID=65515 RepID=UPI00342A1E04
MASIVVSGEVLKQNRNSGGRRHQNVDQPLEQEGVLRSHAHPTSDHDHIEGPLRQPFTNAPFCLVRVGADQAAHRIEARRPHGRVALLDSRGERRLVEAGKRGVVDRARMQPDRQNPGHLHSCHGAGPSLPKKPPVGPPGSKVATLMVAAV